MVARWSETVVVHGKAPVVAPPPPQRPPPRLPPPLPPPVVTPVADHDRDSVCGPAKPSVTAEFFGTIRSRHSAAKNGLYARGDELFIDGGTADGLEVGRNVVARRTYRVTGDSRGATGDDGLRAIEAADRAMHSLAAVASR